MKRTLTTLLAALLLLSAAGCASSRPTRSAAEGRATFRWAPGLALPPHTTTLHDVLEYEIGRTKADLPRYRCTVGAHRGASEAHRENTLSAIRAAEDDPRFAFVEFDVQFTKDDKIVLFHDRSLLRMFGSLRFVGNATYEELAEVTEGEIALYGEAMDLLSKRVNIEIKSRGDKEDDERLVDAIIADVRARGRESDTMISSISSDVVRYVKRTYPHMPTGQIYWLTASTYIHMDRLTERLYGKLESSQADFLMLHVSNLRNVEDLLRLKPPGKTIVFWNFDDRIYVVHKDLDDRLWGESVIADYWQRLRYMLR